MLTKDPKCTWKHRYCFAWEQGNCTALIDTVFPERKDCPFYKSTMQEINQDTFFRQKESEPVLQIIF